MPHESSVVQNLDNTDDVVRYARETLQKLQATDPTKVHCMMGMVVADSADGKGEVDVHAFVLGSDNDIAKMLASLVTMTRDGIVQANIPSTDNNEVSH